MNRAEAFVKSLGEGHCSVKQNSVPIRALLEVIIVCIYEKGWEELTI